MSDAKDIELTSSNTLNYSASLERMSNNLPIQSFSGKQPLANLLVTDKSDPALALIDAFAVVTDVFGLYQQQNNKENYLSSADELFSLRALSRTVGYELAPGVAASTMLAFTVDASMGNNPVTVPKGTKVQSVPSGEALPQTFETDQDLIARAEWNLLKLAVPQGDTLQTKVTAFNRLAGINTGLQVGDKVLLTGNMEDIQIAYVFIITSIKTNRDLNFTEVDWQNSASFVSHHETAIIDSTTTADTTYTIITLKNNLNDYDSDSVTIGIDTDSQGVIPAVVVVEANNASTTLKVKTTDYSKLNLSTAPGTTINVYGVLDQQSLNFLEYSPDISLENSQLYVLQKRAACFGYNAPKKSSLGNDFGYTNDWDGTPATSPTPVSTTTTTKTGDIISTSTTTINPTPSATNYIPTIWQDSQAIENTNADLYLDQLLTGILGGQWILCIANNHQHLYKVKSVSEVFRLDYGLSGQVTALSLFGFDGVSVPDKSYSFTFRDTIIYAQSELLPFYEEIVPAQTIINKSGEGRVIKIENIINGLQTGQQLVIASTPVEQSENIFITNYQFDATNKILTISLAQSLRYRYQPGFLTISNPKFSFSLAVSISDLIDYQQLSISGVGELPEDDLILVNSTYTLKGLAATASEVLTLTFIGHYNEHTYLGFSQDLENIYNPDNTVLYGNVVSATHGETVTEVLGSGDGTKINQRFTLKKTPLTYVPAATPSGTQAALEIRVNGVRWKEASSLLDLSATDKAYTIQHENNGQVAILFGDGINGARLPTGQENVQAVYRVGLGLAGQLPAGRISLLQTQPSGIKSVTNPISATGAANADNFIDAKINAPLSTMALNRIVSLSDFDYFVRSFADISKNQVTVLKPGTGGLIYITIAGSEGAAISESSALYRNLLQAIKNVRDHGQVVDVGNYEPISFNVAAKIGINSNYLPDQVFAEANKSLLDYFSFNNRDFAQSVTVSDVIKVLQNVAGVIAVDVDMLYDSRQSPKLNNVLKAEPARYTNDAKKVIKPAQLLTINPSGIILDEMANF